jgi:peptide/nickel transport system substrate-binding protein
MPRIIPGLALLSCALYCFLAYPVHAQKTGGVLKFFHRDSPASMSIHEEATVSTVAPMMGVFNNLVLFKQDVKQNRLDAIEPELAESWGWSEDYTRVSFRLRRDVKWHDGKPFTARMSNAPGIC